VECRLGILGGVLGLMGAHRDVDVSLTRMEMGMDRIITQHFLLLAHFQLNPLSIPSRTK